ncbi:type VII secretion protein EccCa [Prauserella cavernicola]|uniref:Type VII secretion protein EccCa n=1 Tax=Prauserella cavernicola TaxID=2800127 RepID=A0A934QYX1_9PSEU|nr:type VII secretion protein EccCa [Prauserella cavernicola]MBK1789091.1 type VII secretion protein EccCa [Prauserella cavernicola]
MATVVVRRPARRASPEMPSGELVLDAPPEIPAPGGRQWTQALTMLPMLAIMGAMLLMFSGSIGGTLRLVVFGLFGVAMLAMVLVTFLNSSAAGKREMGQARRLYLRRLAQHRVRLHRSVRKQRDALLYLHPEPDSLWSLADSFRLWERRTEDADFAAARIGTGPQSPATALVAPDTQPLEQLEPLSALALRRFLTTFSSVPGLPLAVSLTGFARLHVRGDRERAVGLTRAMLAQLATLHAPDDLRIAVCAAPHELPGWDWVKWLPHALHPEKSDAAGPLRLVAPAVTGIEAMLEDVLSTRPRFDPDGSRGATPHLVVVLDGGDVAGSDHLMTGGGVEGVTVIDLTSVPPRLPERPTLILDVAADGALAATTVEGTAELGIADTLDAVGAESLARQLAPLRLTGGARGEQPLSVDLGLGELLDLGDPYTFDPAATWVQRPNRDRLRIMIGIQPDGAPLEVDLKESAQDGMGPHGLLIGATGSGKSELLRTLVLALAVTHPPNSLNFALIDFKGGATFTRLDALPHTSAVITNLADELPLVDRMTDALNGELVRRQELLRAAGNFSSLREYERARAAGAPLPEVPTLLVICDEFSELLSAKPDFIDTFVQIGRVGRSLGVHLLLASQRLEEGRLRGLDTHLSYRIGLRTFSAMDSRTVLGATDAFELPRAPGHGFLKFGTDPMTRFRSAYVSGVHRRADATRGAHADDRGPGLLEYSTAYQAPPVVAAEPAEPAADEAQGESLLDILADRLTGRGTPAHQVWLPPLGDPATLDELLGEPVPDPARGLRAPREDLTGALKAVAGIVDRPFEQRRDPLTFDLSAAAGHVVVMGGPRSGKSTTLRTLVTSLALTNTPGEAQFYCLDFGGGGLAALRGLPHVGGVASRQHAGAVRRTVAQLHTVLAERERRFADGEIDGIAAYRAARARGEHADDPYGDVFLVVDGWQTLRKEFEDVEEAVCDLAARGLAYGVHVIASCGRWFDLRPAVRDLFGSRVELRLGDPIDSTVDRLSALAVPEDSPGRGVTQGKHQMLLALPRADGARSADGLQAATAELVASIAAAWHGAPAPRVQLLPSTLDYPELPAQDEPGMRVAIGIAEQDLAPVRIDFGADPHFLLLGDAQAGKTAFLRLLARRIVDSYAPSQARMVLIDHRRGLLGDITSEHLLGYGTDPATTRELISEAARGIEERLPGKDITPEQLRSRSWWKGPELFILVDDYDLIASPLDNPLQPLLEYLPQGRELGLHVVLTRRTGGASRGLYEPFLSRVRDVGSPGLLLSGDKDEGPLLGGLKPEFLPPGRGRLVGRGHAPKLLQLAWLPPTES